MMQRSFTMNRSTSLKNLVRLAAISLLLVLVPGTANAANVRGRVQRVFRGGPLPLAGVAVTLYNQTYGRTSAFFTDQCRMYYFAVLTAVYYLEVWPVPGGRAVVFGPFVIREPGFDIPPINV